MAAIGEREALEACRTLFGEPADGPFLSALALPSVKRAFRQKALLLHPDRFAGAAPALQRRQTERFQAISGAYETLLAWLDQARQDPRAAGSPARPPAAQRPTRSAAPPRRRPAPPPASPPAPRPAPPPVEPAAARPPPPRPAPPPVEPAAAGPRPQGPTGPAPDRPDGPAPGAPPLGAEGLGTFLYRHGLISQRTLLAALVWQRKGRLRVGELAVRWGWLTPAQVQDVLAARVPSPRFADRAVALGLLTPFRARTLLRFQGSRQRRLGDYFVEHGVLGREQVERLAAQHRADAARAAEAFATATSASRRRTASGA